VNDAGVAVTVPLPSAAAECRIAPRKRALVTAIIVRSIGVVLRLARDIFMETAEEDVEAITNIPPGENFGIRNSQITIYQKTIVPIPNGIFS